MKNADKKILIGILAIFIGVSSVHLFAKSSQLQAKKTWEFKPQQGIVKIGLLVDSSFPQAPSLEILYENDAHPALAEEGDFIREVLHQLPGLGVDPRNVRSISMRGFAEPDVMERIAIAALHSKAWQSRAEVVGGAERVVEELLNSLKAYDALNAAFEEYGLRVKVRGVEKVAGAKCSDLKISDPVCTAHPSRRVPVGANFELVLEKKRAGGPDDKS